MVFIGVIRCLNQSHGASEHAESIGATEAPADAINAALVAVVASARIAGAFLVELERHGERHRTQLGPRGHAKAVMRFLYVYVVSFERFHFSFPAEPAYSPRPVAVASDRGLSARLIPVGGGFRVSGFGNRHNQAESDGAGRSEADIRSLGVLGPAVDVRTDANGGTVRHEFKRYATRGTDSLGHGEQKLGVERHAPLGFALRNHLVHVRELSEIGARE